MEVSELKHFRRVALPARIISFVEEAELSLNEVRWLDDQSRQREIKVQRHTQSIFLRCAGVMMATTRHPEAGQQKPHFHPIEKVGESKFKGF